VIVQFAQVYLIIIVLLPQFGWTLPGLAEDLVDADLLGHLLRAIGSVPRG
jgi:hypothetical protein